MEEFNLLPFLGSWQLDPRRCQYELGLPPKSSEYIIIKENQLIKFIMVWVDQEDQQHQLSYCQELDGQFHPYSDSDLIDEMSLQFNADSLETIGRKHNETILWAYRNIVSPDLLKICMQGKTESGDIYQNISYYQKSK